MLSKKTPAQLQRDIDEALARHHSTKKRPTYLRGSTAITEQAFRAVSGEPYSKLSDAELDARIADIVAGPTVGPGAFKPGQRVTCSYRGEHVGKVLAVDDPRAWANTIAFPQDKPPRRAVKEHVLRHPTVAVGSIPVQYKFGVQWDSRDCLSPTNGGKRSHATKRGSPGKLEGRGQIVVAWISDDVKAVDPHLARVDLGERPKFRDVQVGKAVMWAHAGKEADVEKAQQWAQKEREDAARDPRYATGHSHRVFVYPSTEKDPLGRARREVLK